MIVVLLLAIMVTMVYGIEYQTYYDYDLDLHDKPQTTPKSHTNIYTQNNYQNDQIAYSQFSTTADTASLIASIVPFSTTTKMVRFFIQDIPEPIDEEKDGLKFDFSIRLFFGPNVKVEKHRCQIHTQTAGSDNFNDKVLKIKANDGSLDSCVTINFPKANTTAINNTKSDHFSHFSSDSLHLAGNYNEDEYDHTNYPAQKPLGSNDRAEKTTPTRTATITCPLLQDIPSATNISLHLNMTSTKSKKRWGLMGGSVVAQPLEPIARNFTFILPRSASNDPLTPKPFSFKFVNFLSNSSQIEEVYIDVCIGVGDCKIRGIVVPTNNTHPNLLVYDNNDDNLQETPSPDYFHPISKTTTIPTIPPTPTQFTDPDPTPPPQGPSCLLNDHPVNYIIDGQFFDIKNMEEGTQPVDDIWEFKCDDVKILTGLNRTISFSARLGSPDVWSAINDNFKSGGDRIEKRTFLSERVKIVIAFCVLIVMIITGITFIYIKCCRKKNPFRSLNSDDHESLLDNPEDYD